MITVDREQGVAREVGAVLTGNDDAFSDIIVEINLDEEDTIEISCGEDRDFIAIKIPAERMKRMLR